MEASDKLFAKLFASNSSDNIKLSKTQLHKKGKSGQGQPLLKTGLSLMKYILKPLAKSALIPLALTAAASATDAAIQKKIFGSSMATLIISDEKMNAFMKIVKSLE